MDSCTYKPPNSGVFRMLAVLENVTEKRLDPVKKQAVLHVSQGLDAELAVCVPSCISVLGLIRFRMSFGVAMARWRACGTTLQKKSKLVLFR